MTLKAVVERISADRYRAVISQPFVVESEGQTPDEAVQRVRDLAAKRLAGGQVVDIDVPGPSQPHPWARWAGIWKDNPDFDDYLRNIAEYRRKVDAAEPPP